eukprot:g6390.t1
MVGPWGPNYSVGPSAGPLRRQPAVVLGFIRRHGRHVQQLRLAHRLHPRPDYVRALATCERLRHLVLHDAAAAPELLTALGVKLGPLGADVQLHSLELRSERLVGSGLVALCKSQPTLRRLVVGGSSAVLGRHVAEAVAGCAATLASLRLCALPAIRGRDVALVGASAGAALRSLELWRCGARDGLGLGHGNDSGTGAPGGGPGAGAAAAWRGRLRGLALHGCAGGGALRQLAERAPAGAAGGHGYRALRALRLTDTDHVGGAVIDALAHAPFAASLELLDLSGCRHVCDGTLGAIDRGFTALRSLSLSRCPAITDLGIQLLGVGCARLRELELDGCDADKVTKIALIHLALGCPLGRSLTRLTLPVGRRGFIFHQYAAPLCVPRSLWGPGGGKELVDSAAHAGNSIELLRRIRDDSASDSDGEFEAHDEAGNTVSYTFEVTTNAP